MARNRKPRPRWRRWLGRGIALALLCDGGYIGWNYLQPLVTSEAAPIYESFAVSRGDVETTISYSATISIMNQQSVTASYNGMNNTTVRTIDVSEAQAVAMGDRLAQLSNGEILTAEIDGVVNAINVSVGDRIRPNTTLMDICDFSSLQMTMSVDEYDIDALKAGEPCTVTVLPLGLSFETRLAHVNRLASGVGSVAYYQVTALIDAPENVLPGMQASVTFKDQQAEEVLTLEMAALAFDETGSPYVLILNSQGGYDRQSIETGLSDGMRVEITAGLSEGAVVWAVTGTQSPAPAFTLASLYQQVVGETVIINDQTTRGNRRSRGSGQEGSLPEGMTLPDGVELPEGTILPGGAELPDNLAEPSAGGQRPTGTDAASERFGESSGTPVAQGAEAEIDAFGSGAPGEQNAGDQGGTSHEE